MGVPQGPLPSNQPSTFGNLHLICGDGETPADLGTLVSAADLQAALDRIKIRSKELKEQVYLTLTNHHKDLLRLASTAERSSNHVDDIGRDFASALTVLGSEDNEDGLGADIIASAAEHRELQIEIAAKQRALEAVSLVASLNQGLQSLDKQIRQGHLPQAAKWILSLEQRITGLPDKQSQGPLVFGLLREEVAARRSRVEADLDEEFEGAVVVDLGRGEVRAENVPDGGGKKGLETSWEALDTLDLLDRKLEKLAAQLSEGPVALSLKKVDLQVLTTDEEEEFAKLRFAGVSSEGGPATLVETYSSLVTVVQFIHRHVMHGDRSKTLRLGQILWPKIAKTLINGPLTSAVPSEASRLPEFEPLAKASAEFEKALEAEGLISKLEKGHELSAFAADIDVHFATKKRTSLLARARGLVTLPDLCLNTVTVGSGIDRKPPGIEPLPEVADKTEPRGKKARPLGRKGGVGTLVKEGGHADASRGEPSGDMPGTSGRQGGGGEEADEQGPFFYLPTCQVSTAVQQLAELAHEALREATQSSARTALQLHRTARDVLQLYRAIVPVQRQHQLESVPQLAMVFHNDCLYIAHHALMLGIQYKNALPPSLRDLSTLADLAPAFEQLADVTRSGQVRQQRDELMRALDEGKGFRFTDEEVNFKGAERAIKKVLHVLGHLATIWRPVLSRGIFHDMMTSLAEACVARVASEVLQLDDIAVEETTQLRHLLRTLLEGLPDVLTSPPAGSGAETIGRAETASRLVPTGPKLLRLIDFLDMSLRDINAAWESGNLPACGFRAPEVQRLIRAIFSDTPLQREVLARMDASKQSDH
ncbi:centromere/kinetochore protein zw10 [Klebsormidium nitens]|uniref:Centromere/kinetochore protein zw10 n=1 Tax=Klebsormidium nitens TaxID=105231 RepID=A0A1Y1IF84_KLENI|nr:centromere/kinetochore protein zw10 [Klebsormidium nitens]|eukprot:GAQ88119.1 centromere/kinetochore protein zw10 [Klebsormidium nitens]